MIEAHQRFRWQQGAGAFSAAKNTGQRETARGGALQPRSAYCLPLTRFRC